MPLCSLCQSIPLLDVPSDQDSRIETLVKCIQLWYNETEDKKLDRRPGIAYQPSIAALRASAESCDLCRVVSTATTKSLSDHDRSCEDAESHQRWGSRSFETYAISQNASFRITRMSRNKSALVVVLDVPGFRVAVATASIYMFVPSESRLAEQVSIRQPPGSSTVSDESMTWLKDSIEECQKSHESCRLGSGPLPRRVLDLGEDDTSNTVRLVETKRSDRARYASLSYCWGRKTFLTSKRMFIEQYKDHLDIQELPKTLRDAVIVTRKLGLRYIWIDALCIIQDSDDDWAIESAKMASIYENAWITIAALDSAEAVEGCAWDLPTGYLDRVSFPIKNTQDTVGLFCTHGLGFDGREEDLDPPLDKRAWALQERLLAARTAYMRRGELGFECSRHVVSQFTSDANHMPRRLLIKGVRKISENPRQAQDDAWNDWRRIIEIYSSRNLTKRTDRLPALSGMASRIEQRISCRYVAGLWKTYLIEGISFRMDALDSEDDDHQYVAPSWSWASHVGRAVYDGVVLLSNERIAEVVAFAVTPKANQEQNPYGEISSAWLKLKAPLLSLKHGRSQAPNNIFGLPDAAYLADFKVEVDLQGCIQVDKISLDPAIQRSHPDGFSDNSIDLFALVLNWTRTSSDLFGLIVCHSSQGETNMKRVGTIHFECDDVEAWKRLSSRLMTEVVLV